MGNSNSYEVKLRHQIELEEAKVTKFKARKKVESERKMFLRHAFQKKIKVSF